MNPSNSGNAAYNQRIALTINAWKNKLLDISKRNRALNFKPNKVSTVSIVEEQAAEIFRLLCLNNKSLKFNAKPETQIRGAINETGEESAQDEFSNLGEESYEEDLPSMDFMPYDSSDLAGKYTDDTLQTNSTAENLDKSLRRLEEQDRSSQEEQGVSTLFLALGILHYNESVDSKEFYKAPLILVPVELARKSARAGYTIKTTDDDAIVNPSLAEYLRRDFKINLPELPDSGSLDETYDLQTFFREVQDSIQHQASWSVKNEIQLGLFSFQKLVMFKDLEKNAASLADHSIINKIITRSGDYSAALPDDVRTMELDRDFAPEATAQVVDADSSQLRAIATVAKHHNLVIEGPPGTGKSQTITNLIAQSLSAGKSVLFVAEKMAALDVVHRRLVEAGLGEFCLELHSTKANKLSVMKEIRKSLDSSLNRIAIPQASSNRLPEVRRELTSYINAVHTPFGTLNQSPYKAFSEVGLVLEAPKVVLQNDIFGYTQAQIETAQREAEDLARVAEYIGLPAVHPWRDTTKTYYSEHDFDQIESSGATLRHKLAEAIQQAKLVENSFGLPPIKTFADVETAIAIATVMARSPGAPMQVLGNESWNTPPAESKTLIEMGRRAVTLRQNIENKFTPLIFEQDLIDEIAYVEQKSAGIFSFLAFLDSRFRAIKKRWLNYRLASYSESLVEQASEMKLVVEYQNLGKNLKDFDANGTALFGALWEGEGSNWSALENYISWVLEFRRLCVVHGLREQALATASSATPNLTPVQLLVRLTEEIKSLANTLCLAAGFPANYFTTWSLEEIQSRIGELVDNLSLAPRWAAFEDVRQKVEKTVISELLPQAMQGQIRFDDMGVAFKRAFYQKWLAHVIAERTELRSFHTLSHELRVKEFQELDQKVLHENRASLVSSMRETLQHNLRSDEVQNGMRFLRRELAKQRGLAPLRVTMKQSVQAIRAIKPCFMMSPQTVAQLLDDVATKFDLVIFDEASQLPTEEAVGAILRGQQLVVVGDPKQLPPTNFFAVQSGQVNAPIGDDGLPIYDDSQSILEEVMGAGVPQSRLKWHYRSAHESLIAFSNVNFYDADLYTFPSVDADNPETGLHFEYVDNGIYEGKGLNMMEAKKVVDAAIQHIKTNNQSTLGIGTFNMRQQLAIQDELELRRREDPSIESFFDKSKTEPFFVKNLENIQGDERDVIFLSVTYAKASDGKMRYNLGPLNSENGWRRLNVLTTRARKLMRVFSSIHSDEINLTATESNGARLLKDFLTYAEHKRLDSPLISALNDTESPFEREVMQELTRFGLDVIPQIGVCGYRIDLGIQDKEKPGRFVCGIECDGLAYHSSETARDRDRLRQQVLEARGWDIHRLWSTDWFKDRKGQIERLLILIEQSRVREKNEAQRQPNEGIESSESINLSKDATVLGTFAGDKPTPDFVNSDSGNYVRPTAEPYRFASALAVYSGQYLLEAQNKIVTREILNVVDQEAPLHIKDLTARVSAMWGQKTGSNINSKIRQITDGLQQIGRLKIRGDFIWRSDGRFQLRSRNNTLIPAERIAPEEIQEAVLQVLRAGQSFTRQKLVNEVRSVFGFTRTGPALQQVIDATIERLLSEGLIGEGGMGIGLRK